MVEFSGSYMVRDVIHAFLFKTIFFSVLISTTVTINKYNPQKTSLGGQSVGWNLGLRLKSWSHGLWVRAPHRALYCQHRTSLGSSVPLSLPLPTLSSLFKKWMNVKKNRTENKNLFGFCNHILESQEILRAKSFENHDRNCWTIWWLIFLGHWWAFTSFPVWGAIMNTEPLWTCVVTNI